MRKINIKLVVVQWIGILFLICGVREFCNALYWKENLVLLEKFNDPIIEPETYDKISDFFITKELWAFCIALFGIFIVTFINRKRKIHFLNSILVSILVIAFFVSEIVLQDSIISLLIIKSINYFEEIFVKNSSWKFFIGGTTFTIIGSLLILKSLKLENTHSS